MNLDGTPDEEDLRFFAVHGSWDPLTPEDLLPLLDGFEHPWWLVGGHAMEAFHGVRRPHEDVDLTFFPSAVQDLRRLLEPAYHLWSNDGGTFRFLDDEHPEPLAPVAQIWVRSNAQSPWLIDCPVTPEVDGRWQSKRDPEHVADLDDVTWVDERGIRFLNPEIALLFKAAQDREKDRFDLDHAWPLLSDERRTWLLGALGRWDAQHPWLGRLGSTI